MTTQLAKKSLSTPLGQILEEAGLISSYQIDVALRDQIYNSHLLIGEILALRGWIDQETADFFAVDFPLIKKQQQRELIGTYLEKAKLLTKEQIDSIIEEQEHNLIPFVSLAVLKGYLKQKTLNFLEEHLFKDEQKLYLSHPFKSQARILKRKVYQDEIVKTENILNNQTKKQESKLSDLSDININKDINKDINKNINKNTDIDTDIDIDWRG